MSTFLIHFLSLYTTVAFEALEDLSIYKTHLFHSPHSHVDTRDSAFPGGLRRSAASGHCSDFGCAHLLTR
jgi:hypothetical protein